MLTRADTKSASNTLTAPRSQWLGAGVDYYAAWDLQRRYAIERAEGRRGETLLLLEHAPVYTAGRRSLPAHVLGDLAAPLVETDRGGQVTYHGPGQLVGYPIVSLRALGIGPKAYVRALELALVDALGGLGVPAYTEPGLTGVWTNQGKIAAIGVKITQGVAMHGFALNVSTDLTAYDAIVPCGLPDRQVTSIAGVLGAAPPMASVRETVVATLGTRLGIAWVQGSH
ncbi:MAG: lipoyl(octanoyl) transferase LipB [Dehalococcoidia bacterium]